MVYDAKRVAIAGRPRCRERSLRIEARRSQREFDRAADGPVAAVTMIDFDLPNFRLTYISERLWIVMPDRHDILFRSLADPTRRAIFERLCREGEQTVGALTARSGVSQPAVSKHLGILRQAGLVCDRHEGRQTHYSAQLGALAPLIDWTSQMAGFWQSRFDHLEDLLKRMDQ